MTLLNKFSSVFLRRQKLRKGSLNRHLQFELMESRYAFSVDLPSLGSTFDVHDDDHRDSSGFELHVLTNLPNQQADPVNPQNTLSTTTPTTLADTFKLHSNSGAKQRIFLDFDGHVTSGTIWNSNYTAGRDIVTPAFDLDGNQSSFSDWERQRIQYIWERVSEDFIPFNVDVTTEDPGVAALTNSGGTDAEWGVRIVIGGSSSDWWGTPAGGVAYVGSFNWASDTPGFVFTAQLGNGDEKYTAEAISHETGHTLGLSHDGRTNPPEEYYAGQGSGDTGWAPIMGNGYYKNLTQWSKGEYAYASQAEDDLTIITTQNGFSYRVDDHGNSNASASLLDVAGSTISDWGIIERTTDVDYFYFATDAGSIQINVNPLDRGTNLDVFLELYDSSNVLIASSNPTDLLTASITTTVTAQQYYLRVSGTGRGSASVDGYSRYASLGQYFVSGTIVPATTDFLSVTAGSASKSEGNSASTEFTFVVNRAGSTSGTTTVNYSVQGSGVNPTDANDFSSGVLPSGTVTFAPGEVSKTISIWIAGDTLVESDEGFTVTLSNASGATVISSNNASGLIVNDDQAATPGVIISPTSGLITQENGSTASFTVVLNSKPTSNVTIQVTSLDTTEGRVSTSQLIFTPTNWNVAQRVTVTGVDDTIRDGNITYLVDLSAASSTDTGYNGMQVADVQVTNQDNERGGKRGAGGATAGNQQSAGQSFQEVDYWMNVLNSSYQTNPSRVLPTERASSGNDPARLSETSNTSGGRLHIEPNFHSASGKTSVIASSLANRKDQMNELTIESIQTRINAIDTLFSQFELG